MVCEKEDILPLRETRCNTKKADWKKFEEIVIQRLTGKMKRGDFRTAQGVQIMAALQKRLYPKLQIEEQEKWVA